VTRRQAAQSVCVAVMAARVLVCVHENLLIIKLTTSKNMGCKNSQCHEPYGEALEEVQKNSD